MELTELTKDERELVDYIKRQIKPITRSTVANTFELECFAGKNNEGRKRVLRELVRSLNGKGYPILPSNEGYYYSDNPDTINREMRRLMSNGLQSVIHAEYLQEIENKIRNRNQAVLYPQKEENSNG